MSLLVKTQPFFTMLGGVSAALALLVATAEILPSSSIKTKIQLFGAKAFAPTGYDVIPSNLETIPENSTFIRGVGGTALLTSEELTFAVSSD